MTTTTRTDVARETLVTALKNAHSMEVQAASSAEAHLTHTDGHTEFQDRLRAFADASRTQAERIEGVLTSMDESSSTFKDTVMKAMGYGQSKSQAIADDGAVRACLAMGMLAHLHANTYSSIFTLADEAGIAQVKKDLETSRDGDTEAAEWFDGHVDQVTKDFLALETEKRNRPSAFKKDIEKAVEERQSSAAAQ